MTFSHYAGIAIVPTLSRIVLAAVFITAGWKKFQPADFTPEQAKILDSLGVHASPKATPVSLGHAASVRLVCYRQTQPEVEPPLQDDPPPPTETSDTASAPAETQEPPADQADGPAATAPGTSESEEAPASTTPASDAGARSTDMYTTSQMHHVTLMVHALGWPAPVWLGRLTAFTELIGGALLAVGLFSRLWGFALAIVMAVAIYMTSLPELQQIDFKLFAMGDKEFSTFIVQSALFVLAFGVALTGAGPLSLDRFLFGGRETVVEVDVEKK